MRENIVQYAVENIRTDSLAPPKYFIFVHRLLNKVILHEKFPSLFPMTFYILCMTRFWATLSRLVVRSTLVIYHCVEDHLHFWLFSSFQYSYCVDASSSTNCSSVNRKMSNMIWMYVKDEMRISMAKVSWIRRRIRRGLIYWDLIACVKYMRPNGTKWWHLLGKKNGTNSRLMNLT